MGKEYEYFLNEKLGSSGSFRYGGAEFDGAFDNVWYEAKAGNFWGKVALKDQGKWRSKFGSYQSLSNQNGKVFHLYSQGSIPEIFKQFFDKKGIKYFENFKN